MNNLYTILDKAGLSPSEQTIYSLGLETGETGSRELIRRSKLPRPTVIAALQSLRKIGLCSSVEQDKRSFVYTMQPLSNLKVHFGNKIRETEELIENIDREEPKLESSIHTQNGLGAQKLQDFLELALRCKSRQWRIIAPRDNALKHMSSSYVKHFKKVRSERQVSSQTLWESAYSNQAVSLIDTLMRKPRYIPKDFKGTVPAILLSFDNSLLIISGLKQPVCTLITNTAATASFNLVFDLAWRSCREKDK